MSLIPASFLLALAWLLLWRWTSVPCRTERVTGQGVGHLLEIGIYKDHPIVLLRCLGDLVLLSLSLGRLLLPASLLFLLPCLLIVPQLASRYDHRPYEVGEKVLVEVQAEVPVSLELPPGLELEAGPLFLGQSVYWRLSAAAEGDFRIRVIDGADTQEKLLRVGGEGAVNPAREQGRFSWLFHPSERPLPSGSSVREIHLDYPDQSLWLRDHEIHWGWLLLVGFFVWVALLNKLSSWIGWRR